MSNALQPIKYGMFIMPFHLPDKPLAQGYDEDLELVVRAEELGFEEFWIGEHHTMKYETIVMPEIFIGRALGETNRIRFGAAPVCLNQHHPAHVAGRLAFLDHLSKGRLNLCFGPGSVTTDQELFGVDPKAGGHDRARVFPQPIPDRQDGDYRHEDHPQVLLRQDGYGSVPGCGPGASAPVPRHSLLGGGEVHRL